ncbi:MAG: single-stranded DNA-binding protein [Clostridia bacterium]|nr:single-stranded DNA-binding protein [Clostridia bacterium]
MNFSKMTIGGRLVADPELKTTQSGKIVCTFRVAASKKIGQTEQKIFLPCVMWGERGQTIARHFRKGSRILAMGELWQREYTDQSGAQRTVYELNCTDFDFVDTLNQPQGAQSPQDAGFASAGAVPSPAQYNAPAPSYVPDSYRQPPSQSVKPPMEPQGWQSSSYQPQPAPAQQTGFNFASAEDDDLPF